MDLFIEYKKRPKNLNTICNKYFYLADRDGLTHEDVKNWLNEVEEIGFTFDYGLDLEPFNLRPMSQKDDDFTIEPF